MTKVQFPLVHLVRVAAVALVVSVPLVVIPWGQDAYSRPKVLVLYSLVAVMLGGWAVLRLLSRRPWTLSAPELAVWAFVLASLISSWTTVNPRLTFFGAPGRYEGLLTLGSYAALYFIGVQFFGSKTGLHHLIRWAALAALPVVVYGVLQLFIDPLFYGEAFTKEWYGGLGLRRVPSTVGGPVVFGGYLVFVIPLLLVLAITARGAFRMIWLAGSSFAIVALALTLTRAAWLAAIVGLVIVAIGVGKSEWRRQRAVIAGVAATVVLAVVLLVTVVATPQQMGTRVASTLATQSGSVASRLFIWQRTFDLIRTRPLLGWGIETLREIFPYERNVLVRYFGLRPVIIDRAHNDTLHMAVSVGVPGTVAYVVFWLLVIAAAVRVWRRESGADRMIAAGWLGALTGYLIQAQFSFSSVALTPIIWLLAGAACGWDAETPNDADAETRQRGNAHADVSDHGQ